MKKTQIGLIISAAFTALVITIKGDADHYAKKTSKDEARQELDGVDVEQAKEELEASREIIAAEKEALKQRIENWEKDNKYRRRVKDVQREADREIRMLEIDPDAVENRRLIEVEDRAKTALAASSKALGLQKAEKDRNKAIKEAQDKYNRQVEFLDQSASSGDSNLMSIASNLRFAAEKDRDKAIEDANKRFNAVKAKYDAKTEEWSEKITNAKIVREEMLAEGRKKILAQRDEKLGKLRDEHAHAVTELHDIIVHDRSEEDNEILERRDGNATLVERWNRNLDQKARDIYKSKTTADKFAAFFMHRKITPSTVLAFGCAPFIGVAMIAVEYWQFLFSIVKKMKGA